MSKGNNQVPQSKKPNGGDRITPNSGRNIPNMIVKTPMPKVKPPKNSNEAKG